MRRSASVAALCSLPGFLDFLQALCDLELRHVAAVCGALNLEGEPPSFAAHPWSW